jgi:glycosyltransferase involved in cell wall biosynthesis
VAVESLACGTPVVVARDGGEAPRLVEGASGLVGAVFESTQPDDLAATLLDALDLASDRSTAAACRRRAEDFPIDLCAERYIALYHELSGG